MRKGKLKKCMAMALTVILSVVLAGYSQGDKSDSASEGTGSNTAAESSSSENASGEKTKVLVWSKNSHDLDYMTKMVEEYNNTNKDNIEIEYVVQSSGEYVNLLTISASSGQAPDIFVNTDINLKEFSDADIIMPINDYISEEYNKVNEVDSVKYEGNNVLEDNLYWVPTGMRSGSRLIYNIDLFNASGVKVPTTLNETIAVAKKLTEDGNEVSYGTIFPGQSSPFERWIEHSAELSGVTPYDYVNGKFDFSGYKPFIEAIRQMFEDGSVFPGSANMQIDPTRTQFAAGNVGFYGNASQEAGVLTDQFPAENEWAVAQLPTLDGTIKGAESCTPSFGWFMSGQTKNADAAWKVIEYFGSEEFLKGYIENGYCLPISKYMDSVVDKTKLGRLADFSLEDYEAVYPKMPTVTPAGATYRDALWNACLPDGNDIDETIDTMNKTYNEALDNDVKAGKIKRLVIKDFNPLKPNEGTVEYLAE
ncbi:MAG: extracellular solute-binding protein [Anaerocolumna sp.]